MARISFQAIGTTGLKRSGGYIHEEYLPELRGARGRQVYREMSEQSSLLGGILFAIEMMIRAAEWSIQPGSDLETDVDQAEFVQTCLEDMETPFKEELSEILTELVYGFAPLEILYKWRHGDNPGDPTRHSAYNDGLIGWRDWSIRAQESVQEWIFDEEGHAVAFIQQAEPDFMRREVPLSKCMLFRTTSRKDNPEGQALALDTPIPTPDGWKTMGELAVGDRVFDEQGRVRYVTAKSEVWKARPAYEVVFTSGARIVADEKHRWAVTTFNDRSNGKPPRLLTTREIFEWQSRPGKNPSFCFGQAPVLDGVRMALPIDPYVLGYWLGDGASRAGEISVARGDFESLAAQLEAAGYSGTHNRDQRAWVPGLKALLRSIGVLEDKHIPQAYLRASVEQRLALLQGLMDSDGTTPAGKDKASRWYSSNLALVTQFCELVRTLGGRPHVRVHTEPGHECGTINGHTVIQRKPLYEVSFYLGFPAHRLPRKAGAQVLKRSDRVSGHFLKEIRFVGHADTVCIEVDGPSHLFLAGAGMVPTHNSVLRRCYRDWYFIRHLETIEGIGAERDLAGLPVIYVPSEILAEDASEEEKAILQYCQKLVSSIRRDEQEGLVMPGDVDQESGKPLYRIELLSTGGQRQFDTDRIIRRKESRMAAALLADFMLLGHEGKGSYALSSDKTAMFSYALGAWMDGISAVVNPHIKTLLRLNGMKWAAAPPYLHHGDVETVDPKVWGEFLQNLAAAGGPLTPDVFEHIYRKVGLPVPEGGLGMEDSGAARPRRPAPAPSQDEPEGEE